MLPAVCVKTGVATDDVASVRGSASPQWTGVMILFGFLAWVVALFMTGRRYALVVPLRGEVYRRHRDLGSASVATVVAGMLLGLFTSSTEGRYALWFLGLAGCGVVLGLVNEWVNSFGVRLAPDGTLVLTRVHPRFRDAVLSQLP
jgi:type IV secretory pathway TrbD component